VEYLAERGDWVLRWQRNYKQASDENQPSDAGWAGWGFG
jgi:hypothetical protein